ncbi:hypothetical protein EV643_1032 [Kribbella sp. VKM Ac-2527]|uniref:Uncharacterized protein n=1 Tax=Kribbella caucasensis TaxID=2512215 RepID=A0A4R6KLK6_9ACTN|nr:hypothetical protein [Kribbella sp. VKM Ac-2527]TDO51265.1 hypothetical protein EV643_1032 [Kribbella sp. VKM Ac-2527]
MIRGRIIAESLKSGADLQVNDLRLVRLGRHEVSTSTLPVDERSEDADQHGAVDGQPTTWTFIDFEAPDTVADELAQVLTAALEPQLGWWADFTINETEHAIVFAERAFRYCIGDAAGRAEAVAWGRAAGTPEHQLDWGP